jgi:predicted polyphosphate/ATP-dependent NAD kinase
MTATLHVGLVINPLAGLGGSLALKGSDGAALREFALDLTPDKRRRALDRTLRALKPLVNIAHTFKFTCWAGAMGESALQQLAFSKTVLGSTDSELTRADDTRRAVTAMIEAEADLILFAGGDGTARDICDVVGLRCPVLGIPAGVKMHSGVFAVSPEAAGELLCQIATGGLVNVGRAEVRDIDEDAFRRGTVRSRFYGELLVPSNGHYLQHTKAGGREDQGLAAADIAAWQLETMEPGRTYLVGPGSTTAAIMAAIKLPNTLLGVDVVRDSRLVAGDVNEEALLRLLRQAPGPATILVTAIGGQGHIFGRGNQQLSPAVIRSVGLENISIVAAKSKIADLSGRPLLVDTNDAALDLDLCGMRMIVTGYDDCILYRVSTL